MKYSTDLLFLEAKVFDLRQLHYFCVNTKQHLTKHSAPLPTHSYSTRQKDNYLVSHMTKAIGQRSITFLAPRLYNTLPKSIQNITNIFLFKKKLKEYTLSKSRTIISNYIDFISF